MGQAGWFSYLAMTTYFLSDQEGGHIYQESKKYESIKYIAHTSGDICVMVKATCWEEAGAGQTHHPQEGEREGWEGSHLLSYWSSFYEHS